MNVTTISVIDRDKVGQLKHVISYLLDIYEKHPAYSGDDTVAEADDMLKMLDGQCLGCAGIFESLKQYYKDGFCTQCTRRNI